MRVAQDGTSSVVARLSRRLDRPRLQQIVAKLVTTGSQSITATDTATTSIAGTATPTVAPSSIASFGVTLLVKLALFAALVAVGARSRFRHVPAAVANRVGGLRRSVEAHGRKPPAPSKEGRAAAPRKRPTAKRSRARKAG